MRAAWKTAVLVALGLEACSLPSFNDFVVGDGGGVEPAPPVVDCSAPIPIAGEGYREGFEAGAGGWRAGGESASWELGAPAGERVTAAAEGASAWGTGLDHPYADRELSYLSSPCFDASGTSEDLLLTFALATRTEGCCDRAWVEVTTDGETWARVDADESSLEWYAAAEVTGWSGGEGEWRRPAAALPGTAGESRVAIRFAFSSDGSVAHDGVFVDDVALRPLRTDLEVGLAPGTLCGQAVATVRNVGGAAVSAYELATVVDGTPGTETVGEPLRYLEARDHLLGSGASTAVEARVTAAGDADAGNDSARWSYAGLPLGSGLGWDFEEDDGGLAVEGVNATWAWGEPGGSFITGAASGARAWVTNPTGPHSADELSFLLLPCLDLRGLGADPTLRFALIFATEACCDEGWVELSTGGGDFARLGADDSGGTGWYNDAGNDWWDGRSGEPGAWTTASHPLVGAAGHDRVRVRFVFSSDGSAQEDGFGIDDLAVVP